MSVQETSFNAYAVSYAPDSLSDDFVRLCQTISNNIQQIWHYVGQMQRLVEQIGTVKDSPDLRDRLSQDQQNANQLAKDTKKCLTDLQHLPPPHTQSEQVQRKVKKDRLMKDFMSSLNGLQATQRNIASKSKESLDRVKTTVSYDMPPEDNMTTIRLDSNEDGYGGDQSVMEMEDADLELLQERERAIQQLESDIVDVNQIFKDLGVLVFDQGLMIDSIEANIETASTRVEQGEEQLRQARNYQRKKRKMLCVIGITVIILLTIIGVIIGVTVSNK